MNMKIFVCLLLLVIPLISQGGQLPEKKILDLEKISNNNTKVDLLWEIVKITFESHPDTALYFAREQLEIAKTTGNQERYINAVWAIGIIHKDRGTLQEAATYLFEAHRLYKDLNYIEKIPIVLYNIGQVFMAGKDYNNAILYLKNTLSLYQQLDIDHKESKTHYEMARCYIEMGNYEKSLFHLHECLSLNDSSKNQSLTSKAHNYLGATYFNKKEYNKAIEEYFLSMEAAEGLKDFKKKSAIAYNNIGESYLYSGDLKNAEIYLLKALKLKKELGDHDFTLSTQVLLSRLATKKEEYEKALAYLQEGIMLADKSIINTNLMDALDEIIALNEQQSTVKIPSDQIISYFKIENRQARLLRGLNEELGSLNSQYVLKNAFETYQLSEANSSLTDKLSQSKVIIILTVLLSLFTGILSVYYVRKYIVLKEFKQETTLGLELISHQLERTIKMASKK